MKLADYHEQKTFDCLNQGIYLNRIWKHDWNDDKCEVQSMLEQLCC